jgi:hypothetical protein
MNNNKNVLNIGLNLCEVLCIIFIVLKVVGVINWSWLWVVSPLWIDLALVFLIYVGFFIYYKIDEKKYKK